MNSEKPDSFLFNLHLSFPGMPKDSLYILKACFEAFKTIRPDTIEDR